ncbi:MAG: TonB-dependent receptor [Gemmatimonadales bacterium]
MSLRQAALWLILSSLPRAAVAQDIIVQGAVVTAETTQPVSGARITALGSGRTTTTNRFGAFSLALPSLPDTILAAFVGMDPVRYTILAPPDGPVRLALRVRPFELPDLMVTGASGIPGQEARPGNWSVPALALKTLASPVEPDVLRGLQLVPAVSFTSPLSARPLIRGYPSDAVGFRIDGFPLVNPYHIGRFFSSIPANAAERMVVQAGATGAGEAGGLSGTVNVVGRQGSPDGTHGGGNLSFASVGAFAGGGAGSPARWFAAGRVAHLDALPIGETGGLPYRFGDLYANVALLSEGRTRARITAFASGDRFLQAPSLLDPEARGMSWHNFLLGGRTSIWDAPGRKGEIYLSVSEFALDATDLESRSSRVDVSNQLHLATAGGKAEWQVGINRLTLGGSFGSRQIQNMISPVEGTGIQPVNLDETGMEFAAHASWALATDRYGIGAGLRLDAAGSVSSLQPRVNAHWNPSHGVQLRAAAGRSARLYHLASQELSEPDILFYDVWRSAGEDGAPVPTIDDVSLEASWSSGSWGAKVTGFLTSGNGIGELRPPTDPDPTVDPVRFGEARTYGLESQIAWSSPSSSVSLLYTLARSERRWSESWIPWIADRRHTLRLFGQTRRGSHWTLFGNVEAVTGMPVTPVTGIVVAGLPGPQGIDRDTTLAVYSNVFGPENSARSPGTVRMDLGATYEFSGPGKSRMWVGVSVLNIAFGPVAPIVAKPPIPILSGPGSFDPNRVVVNYERLYDIPAIPTLTLRIEF